MKYISIKISTGHIRHSDKNIHKPIIQANVQRRDPTTKGQLISERLFDVLKFPKNQHKNLMNFCPRI